MHADDSSGHINRNRRLLIRASQCLLKIVPAFKNRTDHRALPRIKFAKPRFTLPNNLLQHSIVSRSIVIASKFET